MKYKRTSIPKNTAKENKKEKSRTLKERTKVKYCKKEKYKKEKSIVFPNGLFTTEWMLDKYFQEAWEDFTTHRKQIKKPLTPLAIKKIANKLVKYPIKIAIEALDRSIESGWSGVFPESIKPQTTISTKNPGQIIEANFTSGYQSTFGLYYAEALSLLTDRSKENKIQLASNMVELYNWIRDSQAEEAKEHPDSITPGTFIRDYTSWLDKQNWIQDLQPSAYLPDNYMTKKFINIISNELGFHIISGKYYA